MDLSVFWNDDIKFLLIITIFIALALMNFIRMFGWYEPIDKVFERRFGRK